MVATVAKKTGTEGKKPTSATLLKYADKIVAGSASSVETALNTNPKFKAYIDSKNISDFAELRNHNNPLGQKAFKKMMLDIATNPGYDFTRLDKENLAKTMEGYEASTKLQQHVSAPPPTAEDGTTTPPKWMVDKFNQQTAATNAPASNTPTTKQPQEVQKGWLAKTFGDENGSILGGITQKLQQTFAPAASGQEAKSSGIGAWFIGLLPAPLAIPLQAARIANGLSSDPSLSNPDYTPLAFNERYANRDIRVGQMQAKLKALGHDLGNHDNGGIDGLNGDDTKAAITQFQEAHKEELMKRGGYKPGVADENTLKEIHAQFADLDKEHQKIAQDAMKDYRTNWPKKQASSINAQKLSANNSSLDGYSSDQKNILANMGAPLKKLLITSPYGPRDITNGSKDHKGVDFRSKDNPNQDVFAVADGTVEFVGRQKGYGKIVIINHGHDIKTHYAHLDKFENIKPGQKISKGDAVGKPGGTGYLHSDEQRYAAHLDFGLRVNGKLINSEPFLEISQGGAIRHKGESQTAFAQRDARVSNSLTQVASRNVDGNAARGIRNNNPLNIDYNKNNDWVGQTGVEPKGRFAEFKDPKYGFRAAAHLLGNTYQGKYGLNSIREIVNKWSPSEENGIKKTNQYVKNVSKEMGIDPDQKLNLKNPDTMKSLIKAMVQQENGDQPYDDKTIEQGINMAGIKDNPSTKVAAISSPAPALA